MSDWKDECFDEGEAPPCAFPYILGADGTCSRTLGDANRAAWRETSAVFTAAFICVAVCAVVRIVQTLRKRAKVGLEVRHASAANLRKGRSALSVASRSAAALRGRKVFKSRKALPGCLLLPAWMSRLSVRVHLLVLVNASLLAMLCAVDYRSFGGTLPEWATYEVR